MRYPASSSLTGADARVRAAVAAADRVRRARARRSLAWRAAPYVAAASVCLALVGALSGWPVFIPLTVLGGGLCALAVAASVSRARDVSDRTASAIDCEVGLGGELRSASWFAGRDVRDAWIEWHLDRAAERIARIDWRRVYPAVADPRARLVTIVLAGATLLLVTALPARPGGVFSINKDARPAARALGTRAIADAVPLGLPQELEAFLADAENGTVRADAAALRSLLAKLAQVHDAASLKALARAMGPKHDEQARPPATDGDLDALAERAQRAAGNAAVPPAMRDALEDLADDLSKTAQAGRTANGDPREASPGRAPQDGDAVQTNAAPKTEELSIQSVRDADAGGGGGVLMVARPGALGRDPGTGLGGGAAADPQNGAMPEVGQALRRETVEASANTEGSDALTDLRRKSERGDATVSFTHVAPRSFDRGRATAPPALPEQRRGAVQSYFTRKP